MLHRLTDEFWIPLNVTAMATDTGSRLPSVCTPAWRCRSPGSASSRVRTCRHQLFHRHTHVLGVGNVWSSSYWDKVQHHEQLCHCPFRSWSAQFQQTPNRPNKWYFGFWWVFFHGTNWDSLLGCPLPLPSHDPGGASRKFQPLLVEKSWQCIKRWRMKHFGIALARGRKIRMLRHTNGRSQSHSWRWILRSNVWIANLRSDSSQEAAAHTAHFNCIHVVACTGLATTTWTNWRPRWARSGLICRRTTSRLCAEPTGTGCKLLWLPSVVILTKLVIMSSLSTRIAGFHVIKNNNRRLSNWRETCYSFRLSRYQDRSGWFKLG